MLPVLYCLRPSAAVQRVALEPGGAAAAPASMCIAQELCPSGLCLSFGQVPRHAVSPLDMEGCGEHSTQNSGYQSVALLREALCFRVGPVTTAGCVQDLCLLTSPTARKPFTLCQRLTLPLVLRSLWSI